MPLLLKWQAREIALYEKASGEEVAEERLLNRVELDFDLGPLTLTTDEDRHRLLAALAQLQASAEIGESQVDLVIPASWGVTHQVPNPSLPEEDLRDHLRWELSKALIDSEDQYRYNFAYDDEGGIILAALRLRLLEPIEQVIQESGFHLGGLYLEGDPWGRVNLAGVPHDIVVDLGPKPVREEPQPAATPKKSQEEPPPPSDRAHHPWFFAIVLALGVIVIVIFAWWKITSQRKPGPLPEPVTQIQETAPVRSDTVAAGVGSELPAPKPSEARPGALTLASMSERMELLEQTLLALGDEQNFEVISFTESYFLCQVAAPDEEQLESAIRKVEDLPGLTDVRIGVLPPSDDFVRATVSGVLALKPSLSAVASPDRKSVISLGKKHGLKNKGLIFTGGKQPLLSFLREVASADYAVHRLVFVPWEENEYRAVLEL